MPYKHPTGVMVQTVGEFFASEAAAEGAGRSGGDLMSEFFDDMEADIRRHVEEERRDNDGLLRALKSFDEGCDEEDRLHIEEVLDIVDVDRRHGARQSEGYSIARVRAARGTMFVRYEWWEDAGTYYDPPEGEVNLQVVTRDDVLAHLRERVKLADGDDAWFVESLARVEGDAT